MKTKRRVIKKRNARNLESRLREEKKNAESRERYMYMAYCRWERHLAAEKEKAELARAASVEPLRSGNVLHVLVERNPAIDRHINARCDEILLCRHEYITLTAIPQFAVTVNARAIHESSRDSRQLRYITVEALRRIADSFRDEILKSLIDQTIAHGLLQKDEAP